MISGAIPFLIGFLGIVAFTVFRFLEERRSSRFFAKERTSLDKLSDRLYRTLVFGEIPQGYRTHVFQSFQHAVHSVVALMVSTLRKIERPLSRMSHRMRSQKVKNGKSRDPSLFLKTITPEHREKTENNLSASDARREQDLLTKKKKDRENGKEGSDSV